MDALLWRGMTRIGAALKHAGRVVALGGMVACGSVHAAAQLSDGGFEGATQPAGQCVRVNGSLPMAWKDNSCWHRGALVEYATTVSPARSGKSVMVSLRRGLFQLAQDVALDADARHQVAVWLRSERPMVVKLSLRQAGPPYLEVAARTVRVGDQWSRVEVTGYSHGLWSADLRQAVFMVSSATPGVLWIDDAGLKSERVALPARSAAVPDAFFGTHIMHAVNVAGGMAAAPVGSVRVWDSHRSQWHQVQKTPPMGGKRTYDWKVLDDRVRAAERHQRSLLMVVGGYAPAWASMPEGADVSGLPDCHRCDQTPLRMADWRNWVSDLVQRYQGRAITAWEIWNEPSFPPDHPMCPSADACRSGLGSMYRGTPEQLLSLQDEAAKIIRAQDARAMVVSPGVSYHHRNYLDHYLSIGGGRQADVIGYHLYLDGAPELVMSHVLALRAIMSDHGLGQKPLWNTESAISEINPTLDPAVIQAGRLRVTAPSVSELGSAYLARMLIISWAAGFDRVYHYAWDDQHGWPSSPTVVSRLNNAVAGIGAAGRTMAQVRQWMSGRTLIRMETGQNGGLWRAVFRDSAGAESQILWHPGRPEADAQLVAVPTTLTQACRLSESCAPIQGGGVRADYRPVWVGASSP